MSFVCLDAVEKVKNYLRYLRNLCAELLLRREEQFFLATSVFIGVMAGLAVVCFRCSIAWVHAHLMGVVAHPSLLRLFLTPVLSGLVIAFQVLHFAGDCRQYLLVSHLPDADACATLRSALSSEVYRLQGTDAE